VPDDLERRLPDVPAAFPRPHASVTETARRRVLERDGSRRHRRRLGVVAAAIVCTAASVGFTTGYWLRPASVGAATSISFDVKPRESEAFFGSVNAFGAVANGKRDETVVIEKRECDGYGQWSTAAKVVTGNGGTWIAQVGATSTATFRAHWKDATSDIVTVRIHPHLELLGPHGRLFELRVAAGRFFDRTRGTLERRAGNRWVRVRFFTLRRSGGTMGQVPWTYARFRATVKHGTYVRAVLPRSQTGRCYLPGLSNIVRV
jgi:hypothetical protein